MSEPTIEVEAAIGHRFNGEWVHARMRRHVTLADFVTLARAGYVRPINPYHPIAVEARRLEYEHLDPAERQRRAHMRQVSGRVL